MTFYITTPIYYVNDEPHIGHAYSTIVADILTRFHKLFGEDSYFLTGTDEHGQKVQAAAKAANADPQIFVDGMAKRFENIWKELSIEPDIFMRTTADFHKRAVQEALSDLFARGEIYKKEYEGWYSVSEEIFYTEKDLVDGKSPAGKEVQRVSETNYFFRMSKYQQQLIDYIQAHPEFIQPDGKRSETLGFLRKPLEDLCISRPKSRLSWGIEFPFDTNYVTYVWFDALLNYVSALGWGQKDTSRYDKFWTSAVHLIGKDILTTHTVYWPTMLMALGIPLPKTVFAHGWWLNAKGTKMSKSEGPTVKPLDVRNLIGVDAFRYFLCREVNLGNDADFSMEGVARRVNAELANNLGNLLSRSVQLTVKNFDGKVPAVKQFQAASQELQSLQKRTPALVKESIDGLAPSIAVGAVIDLLTAANKYFDGMAPWKAVKENPDVAAECLYVILDILRTAAILLHPVMPSKCLEIRTRLGFSHAGNWVEAAQVGLLKSGTPLKVAEPLFPRVELPA
jgi:methionyl-tRNA synthetase